MSQAGESRADPGDVRKTGEAGSPAAPKPRVLIVDDEPGLRRGLARLLMNDGFDVLTAEDGPACLTLLATTRVDVVLLDTAMPGMTGPEVLARIRKGHPDVEVVMMAAAGDLGAAVAAVRAGAYDLLLKPLDFKEVVSLPIARAAERKQLVARMRLLEEQFLKYDGFGDELVGSSPRMKEVYRLARGAAPTTSTVLIHGENGTGKELLARSIHRHSRRSDAPLYVLHCGAIPERVIEAELFGSVRGASQAAPDRAGIFELADKATLFLDEIGALPPVAQAKLLRALSQGEIRPAGAVEPTIVDVRVIAATSVDLKDRIAKGGFREDLYYRLSVIPIHLPPLRQRRDDIPLLAYHFLRKYARRAGRDIKRIGVEALRLLRDHAWAGNVRELESAIEHAVVTARGDAILPRDLPFSRAREAPFGTERPHADRWLEDHCSELSYAEAKDRAMHAFDQFYLEQLLLRVDGNISEAARQAAMDRSNFRRLLKKAKLPRGSEPEDAGD